MNAHIVTNRSISAGTIARTAVLLLALTNQALWPLMWNTSASGS